jgi:hypothetical protein
MATGGEVPKVTTGRAALIGLIERYLAGLMLVAESWRAATITEGRSKELDE